MQHVPTHPSLGPGLPLSDDYIARQVFRRFANPSPVALGSLLVSGALDVRGGILNGAGTLSLNDVVDVTGNFSVGSNKFLVSASTGFITNTSGLQNQFDNALKVNGDFTVGNLNLFTVQGSTGNTVASGNFTVGSSKLTVAGATGNTMIAGTLDQRGAISNASGDVTIGDTLKVTGAADFDSTVNIDGNLTVVGRAINHLFPSCRAERQAAQSITDNTWTAVSLDTETWDTDAYFAPTSKVLTIPAGMGGLYLICYSARFDVNAAGNRVVGAFLNDSSDAVTGMITVTFQPAIATLDEYITGSSLARLSAGDTLTLKVLQSSGGSLNVDNVSLGRSFGTALEIVRIGS